jgi:hypothetical protein
MRTWFKNGIRFTAVATALAVTGAGMAYSYGPMGGSTLLTGRQDETGTPSLTEPAIDGIETGARPVSRGRMAGVAALAITAAGSAMLIRRLRRRGAGSGEDI